MGSHLLLYYSAEAASLMPLLNAAFASNNSSFGALQAKATEISFSSQRHSGLVPNVHSVNQLNKYLVLNKYMPFITLFGFTEPMPDRPYSIPDWKAALQHVSDHLDLMALDAENFGGVEPLVELLDSFKEMIELDSAAKRAEPLFRALELVRVTRSVVGLGLRRLI